MYNTRMSNVDSQPSKENTLTTSELKKIVLDQNDQIYAMPDKLGNASFITSESYH